MVKNIAPKTFAAVVLLASVSACAGNDAPADEETVDRNQRIAEERIRASGIIPPEDRETIFDLFRQGEDPNVTIEVNKYIWAATLDVLDFLPLKAVDPFTGVIVTDYGTPPGGDRSWRALVLVHDPALDARSLRVALVSENGGAASPGTTQAVEDAILTRARQLRIEDERL